MNPSCVKSKAEMQEWLTAQKIVQTVLGGKKMVTGISIPRMHTTAAATIINIENRKARK